MASGAATPVKAGIAVAAVFAFVLGGRRAPIWPETTMTPTYQDETPDEPRQ